jgi:hypothetical protein
MNEDNQGADTINAEVIYFYPPRKQQPSLKSGHFLFFHNSTSLLASSNEPERKFIPFQPNSCRAITGKFLVITPLVDLWIIWKGK